MNELSDTLLKTSLFSYVWGGSRNCSSVSVRRNRSPAPLLKCLFAVSKVINQIKTPCGSKFLKFQKRRYPLKRTVRQMESKSSMCFLFLACIKSSCCLQLPVRKPLRYRPQYYIRHLAWWPEIFNFLLPFSRSKGPTCIACFVYMNLLDVIQCSKGNKKPLWRVRVTIIQEVS